MRRSRASARLSSPAALLAGLTGLLAPGGARAATAPRPTVKVEVEGVKGELRRNVLANLTIEQERKAKDLDEQRIRRMHAQAPDQISQALQPFGYYKPVVRDSLRHQGNEWVVHYGIDPGPQLKVTHLDLALLGQGGTDPDFERVVASFPLHEGDPVNQLGYEAGKKSFEDYAGDHGYLDGTFRANQIRVDLGTYTCDVVLHYDSGPRYRYGPVVFQQDFLLPALLRGYVKVRQGDPISAAELLELQTDLSASPYFQRVEVVPDREHAQGAELPIVVKLTPSKRQRWTAGLGYGTDTGPRVNVGLEVRRVNMRGHHAVVEGRFSLIERSFHADYDIPGAYPRTDVLTYTLAYAKLQTKTSTTNNALIGASYTQSLGRWRQALRLNFQRATFVVGVDHGTSHLLTPQASWTRVWANDRIFPTHGEKLELDLSAAARSVLSNATFVQARAFGKFIGTLPDRRFRVISRAELGYTVTSDRDFHLLPPTNRFFAGGDQSVRGYAYQGIGPRDVNGHVIGGKGLAVGSVELEYRFLQKWAVAAFFDAGNASKNFSFAVKEGTGVGVRWLSPIGMVRVDMAFAVSEPGHPIRFHLSVGPDL